MVGTQKKEVLKTEVVVNEVETINVEPLEETETNYSPTEDWAAKAIAEQ